MPLVHQSVQSVHAGIAAGRDLVRCDNPHLVLLTIPTQTALVRLSCDLSARGVQHRVFHEEDMGGRPTALATEPLAAGDRRRRGLAGLRLFRGELAAAV